MAGLLTLVCGPTFTGGLLYQFAFSCLLLSIMNLNPLLQWDGYYILMDWLEIPMLRARAQVFVQKELWEKLRKRSKFNREERIFTIYGCLSLVYTALTVFFVLGALGRTVAGFLQRIFGSTGGLILTVGLTIGLVILLLWPLLKSILGRRRAVLAAG